MARKGYTPKMKGVSQRSQRALVKAQAADMKALLDAPTADSFQNFALKLGQGTQNAMSNSTYGFNPITRNRTLLEFIHRGSWLGGVAVDLIADDMTRAKIDIQSNLKPDRLEKIRQREMSLDIWGSLNEAIKWGRLYGGALAMYMIDGQDPATPLNVGAIAKDQFKGLLVLDRWQLSPSLGAGGLVTKFGPHFGMPVFYETQDMAAVPRMKIHYTRVIRFGGVKLPYNQRMMEGMWDMSVLERLYDRMVAFDSATMGAAQLAYKSYLRVMKVKDLRTVVASGGDAAKGLYAMINFMSMFQGQEGITLLDAEDEFEGMGGGESALAGMPPLLDALGQQIAGALQIPVVRLFGQSPGGLNSQGESDMRTYYDGIKQQQEGVLREGINIIYRLMALSEGIDLGNDFNFEFRSLWQLSDQQQAEVADRDTTSVLNANERGVISPKVTLQELRTRGRGMNRWQNITDEMIEEADDEVKPPEAKGLLDKESDDKEPPPKAKRVAKTGDAAIRLPQIDVQGFPIHLEHFEGQRRFNKAVLPADYGFIRWTGSAEGMHEGMDVILGPNHASENIWIIDQYDSRTDQFDEHKVCMGFDTFEQACAAWDGVYAGSFMRRRTATAVTGDQLRSWLDAGQFKEPSAQAFANVA